MERISRKNDEKLYQPAIHSERIRALHELKVMTGIPMTVLLDMAIAKLLDDYQPQVAEAQQNYEGRENSTGN